MPKILVINPNTSVEMTAEIRTTAERVFQPPWQAAVAQAPGGPESLESWTDYQLASVCVLPLLDEHADADGAVLACFGDPGLYLLKERLDAPVVGIAEASMSLALLLGQKFGILAGMKRAVELMDSMVRTYGLEPRYAGTASLEMRVLDFNRDPEATLATLEKASRALRERGAEALLLGCAGLTTFAARLQERVEMPVIDPVEAGCRLAQALVAAGLKTSHVGLYARAAGQKMNDLERVFSPEMKKSLERGR